MHFILRYGGKCSHIAALLYKLHDLQVRGIKQIPIAASCTSRQQQWHKPRGPCITAEPVMKCVFAKAETDREGRQRSPVRTKLYDARGTKGSCVMNAEEIDNIRKSSQSTAPFSYLLKRVHSDSHSATLVSTVFGDVELGCPLSYQLSDFGTSSCEFHNFTIPPCQALHINTEASSEFPNLPLFSLENEAISPYPRNLSMKQVKLLNDLELSLSEAWELEKCSVQQNKCDIWHKGRCQRLTASNFGGVIYRRSVPSTSFLRAIFDHNQIRAASLTYGLNHEKVACDLYVEKLTKSLKRNIKVFQSGLVVNPAICFLGATPDRKVIDKQEHTSNFGLIEIKCPFKYRNVSVVEAASNSDFCLESCDGKIQLKRNHPYFIQVQGQMALSCLLWCDFVVYTSKSLFVERLRFDPVCWYSRILPDLEKFYYIYALDYLC